MQEKAETSSRRTDDVGIIEATKLMFDEGRKELIAKRRLRSNAQENISIEHLENDGNPPISERSNSQESLCYSTVTEMDENSCIKYKDLRVLRTLGFGASAVVKKVVHIPSGEVMAIKIINLSSQATSKHYLCRELSILRYTNSPYFLDFYGATCYEGNKLLYLMENMDLGSLETIQESMGGTVPENVLGKVASVALKGLQYLHEELDCVHRDIKPGNLLLNTKGEVKLGDFGVSGYMDETGKIRSSWAGTLLFQSISFY